MVIPHLNLEKELWKKGYHHVVGVDEAGRGPLAGPVTAGAVLIHKESQIVSEVRDSKYMTAKQREDAYVQICKISSGFGVGIVEAKEIDQIGINHAVQKAMELAIKQVENHFSYDITFVIVDGSKTLPIRGYSSQRILRGGLYHYSISAASILAKVTRDRIMQTYDGLYPNYGFKQHKGYGTAKHYIALKKYGASPIHRTSFTPVNHFLF